MSKLALGTVQFGLDYGVANKNGRISSAELDTILELARSGNVNLLDTATGYGDSEKRLGKRNLASFHIITKMAEIPDQVNSLAWLIEQCQSSLKRLNVKQLRGLLLHRPEQLLSAKGQEIYQALSKLKSLGLVEKIGISIYEPHELEALNSFKFDIYQGPYNIFDTRIKTSGWLELIRLQGAEFHARSAFLQGLLVMPMHERPGKFNRWQNLWQYWHEWLNMHQLDATTACLKFSLQEPLISKTVVGVDSSQQWQELLAIAALPELSLPIELHCDDALLLNPTLWKTL